MDYKEEYNRWMSNVLDPDLLNELRSMKEEQIEDAFYRDLAFGTGGLRGTIGAGTNRMNIYVVAKASQGLSRYLLEHFSSPSVVIGYICEMFACYKTRGMSLLQKLDEIYNEYGYCLNTLHSYEFPGSAGMEKMGRIMADFHKGLDSIGGEAVLRTEDYSVGLNGLPESEVMKFFTDCGSVVVRPSGTEPKLKVYISVTAQHKADAGKMEKQMAEDVEKRLDL